MLFQVIVCTRFWFSCFAVFALLDWFLACLVFPFLGWFIVLDFWDPHAVVNALIDSWMSSISIYSVSILWSSIRGCMLTYVVCWKSIVNLSARRFRSQPFDFIVEFVLAMNYSPVIGEVFGSPFSIFIILLFSYIGYVLHLILFLLCLFPSLVNQNRYAQ